MLARLISAPTVCDVCADYKLIVHVGPRGENHITEERVRDYRLLNAGDYAFITRQRHLQTHPYAASTRMQMSEWIKLKEEKKIKKRVRVKRGRRPPSPPPLHFVNHSAGRKHKLCGESCERVSGFILHLSVFVFRNDAGCLRVAGCQMGCK